MADAGIALRSLRLFDLAPYEAVLVQHRPCGRVVVFHEGVLQRLHRVPSDLLVIDLQYRLRCTHCNSRRDFAIAIRDTRDDHLPNKADRDRWIT